MWKGVQLNYLLYYVIYYRWHLYSIKLIGIFTVWTQTQVSITGHYYSAEKIHAVKCMTKIMMMSVWCPFCYLSSIKEPKHMVQISVMLLLPRNWRQSSEEIPGECVGVPAAMCQKRNSWLDMNVAQSVSPARRKATSGHWGNYFQTILKSIPRCMIWEQESALNILAISNIMQSRPEYFSQADICGTTINIGDDIRYAQKRS